MAAKNGSVRANPRVRKALGQRIRALRKDLHLSQERLGDQARLSGKFIGEVERGEKSISTDSLGPVARALGVSMAELLAAVETRGVPTEMVVVAALVRRAPAVMRSRIVKVVKELVA